MNHLMSFCESDILLMVHILSCRYKCILSNAKVGLFSNAGCMSAQVMTRLTQFVLQSLITLPLRLRLDLGCKEKEMIGMNCSDEGTICLPSLC